MDDSGIVIDDIYRFGPAGPDESLVYGACCPGWHATCDHAVAVNDWIEAMQMRDIERVCCLLAGREPHRNINRYRQAFGPDSVKHVPLPDRRLADRDRLIEAVFPFLEASAREEEPVIVHSLTGLEQTGRVLAGWLVYGRGYQPENALAAVRETGRSPKSGLDGDATVDDLRGMLEACARQRDSLDRMPLGED